MQRRGAKGASSSIAFQSLTKVYSYMEVVSSLYRHLGLAASVNSIATVINFLSVLFSLSGTNTASIH